MVLNAERVATNVEYEEAVEDAENRLEESQSYRMRSGSDICPRCSGVVIANYEEPSCLQCGYVDYHSPQQSESNGNRSSKGVFSGSTKFVLRYVGDSPALNQQLAIVNLLRVRNTLTYGVACPFCEKPMTQSSLSGQRREIKEKRFRCDEGHRVSLVPGSEGYSGWR